MAFQHGSKAKVLLNGYDISGFTKSVSMSGSVDTAEVSVLGNTAKQYVPGLMDATLSLDGAIDGAAGAGDEILNAAFTVATDGLLYLPQGYGSVGQPALGFDGNVVSYELNTDVGDAGTWSASMQSTVGFERGVLLHPYQAEGAGGNSTGYDQTTVSTTAGGVGVVSAASGTTLVVKIQDSADNISFADILTFTTINARSYQRQVIAGTVRRYVRCLWTGTGTFAASFVRR